MDRSFQNTSLTKSPLVTHSPFNRTGKRAVAPSPFRKSSRWSVSGKSTQSVQVVFKTNQNSVERFGQPLPVLITETLTFADRKTLVSAAISEYGYAWVVCGRRLLIWQYRHNVQASSGTPQRKTVSNLCFELQLPQSDLSHRAELVAVFLTAGSHSPSCIAVSPEGLIRYWPSISHEDVSIEQTVDLQGQECDSLTEVDGLGCILATTTCSIVLIQPQLSGGRNALNCRPLKAPTGWLGGISKKMSSFIFGPISSEQSAETRLVRVHSVSNQNGCWTVFILAGHSLQKWNIATNEPEQLIYMVELNRLVSDNFRSAIGDSCVGELDTWILDIQHDNKDCLFLLTAAVNMQYSPQIHYALMCIPISNSQPNIVAKTFKILKIMEVYREDTVGETLSFKFLWCNNFIYLFNQKKIVVFKTPEEYDVLEFNAPQDLILGGSVCVNTPIFFLKNNGLVSVMGSDIVDFNLSMGNASLDQSVNDNSNGNNLSVYHLDPMEIYNAYTDTLGQMKAAFIFHIKNQSNACQDIVNELFPPESESSPSIDSVLDKVVVTLCRDIINDKPACDPRWTNEMNPGIGSSYSMQIVMQLQDKHKALNLFCKFLRDTNLWSRLGAHAYRDGILATVYILAEFSEKLIAAVQLKSFPSDPVLDKAIDKAVQGLEIDSEFGLTSQDVFYSAVNDIHKGLQELVNGCSDIIHSDMNPGEISSTISKSNTIILNVLKEVLQYRKNNSDIFSPQEAALNLAPDYCLWISANGSEGLAECLWDQHNFTCNYALKYTSNKQLKHDLNKQLVSLIDIILDGRKNQVHSIRNSHRKNLSYKQYCLDRYKLILPLIEEKEWESATQLAEKFLDFDCLIRICDATDNQQRLDDYMNRFQNEGFTEHVYNWYLKENKQAKLIEKCRKLNTRNAKKLTGFLGQHPSLLWMQQIFDKQFSQASLTLSNLSEKETDSLTKQKTMCSLAKLAKLAAPNSPDTEYFLEDINSKLELISYQEDIPDYVLQQFGYNTTDPQVLSAKEIINLYICPEYSDSTELEFKKALDVLKYIESSDDREDMYLRIWRQALLRDTWQYSNLDSALDILQGTLIFKIVDVAISMGAPADLMMPSVEILLDDPSVEHLRENKACVYLLKTGYEHIQRLLSC